MSRALPFVIGIFLIGFGCGESTIDSEGDNPNGHSTWGKTGSSQQALQLTPRIELTGVSDVFDALELTQIAFNAQLFVLPERLDDGLIGDAVPLRYDFNEGIAQSVAVERDLVLPNPGNYRVLLRVEPADDGVSLNVSGAFGAPEAAAREKGQEPAPTTAEPAPTTADGNDDDEPAPTTAEPAPTTAEPAPTAADGTEGEGEANEPAPTTADSADSDDSPSSEPAPTTAEPAPTTARNKGDTFDPGVTEEAGERLFYTSREAFEFYAGVVSVTAESRELVVTWDVRPWLRLVLSEPLGIPETELGVGSTGGPSVGFRGATNNFKISTH
jgi:hypothetical protein